MQRQHGLTLLELVIAVAVFALFSVMAYGALDQILTHRDRVEDEQTFWRTLSLVFVRLEEDLGQARPRSVRDIDGQPLPSLRGQPTDTRALAAPSLELTRGGVLEFTEQLQSSLQRVGYRLDGDTLLRLTWPVLDRGPQTKAVEVSLLREVETFSVRFYNPVGDWLDTWPREGANDGLPRGVEITLRISGRGEFTRFFVVNG
ncbi:MAG: type II secretion system minor pseudopilin GspJ [Acidiferrobacterales bacterium]